VIATSTARSISTALGRGRLALAVWALMLTPHFHYCAINPVSGQREMVHMSEEKEI
jgi:hypothetical protein